MHTYLRRATVFVLYQLSLFAGILLLPVALALNRAGITLPVHRLVDRFKNADTGDRHERTAA